MGAKSQLRDWLVTNFPKCHTYVEPFGGSFKVLLWKPYRDRVEIINDIDADLVHFFQYTAAHPGRLVTAINSLPTHEALILGLRRQLADRELTGLERAAAFYVACASSFNGMVSLDGRYGCSPHVLLDCSVSPKALHKLSKRLKGVSIRSTSYKRIIQSANKFLPPDKYPPGGVFFYLDPPYWGTTGYSTYQGASSFGWAHQVELADLCLAIHKMGNKFIQTNSDHEDLKELYGSFKNEDGSPLFFVERREVYYSVAGKQEAREEAGEFVISNFELKKQRENNKKQGGLFG